MRRLGIVGHRRLEPAATAFVSAASRTLIRAAHPGAVEVVAVSALAEGADTLFAEAAVELGAALEIVRPFDGYEDDFPTEGSRRRYRALVAAACHETRLPFAEASNGAYESAMRWVAERCDVLVAAWDGSPPRGTGGTADTVGYAEAIGRSVIYLDVAAGRVGVLTGAAR
jgi:hypothetical protein